MSFLLQRRHALLPAFVLLAACAQAPYRPLAARDAVKSTDVVVLVPQKELDAQIVVANSSAATAQFGLIGALVGSAIDAGVNASRASEADAAVRPLRDALLGFDFDTTLQHGLEHELGSLAWLGPQHVSISKQADDSTRRAAVINTTAGSVLLVDTSYELTPDFRTLRVAARVALMPAGGPVPEHETRTERNHRLEAVTSLDKALYYNSIVSDATLDYAGKLEENRAKWGENAGDLLKRSLQFQVAELARVIALDVQAAAAQPGKTGQTVEDTDAARLVRNPDGTLKEVVSLAKLPGPAVAATVPADATAPAAVPATAPVAVPATAPAEPASPAAPAPAPATPAPAPAAPAASAPAAPTT